MKKKVRAFGLVIFATIAGYGVYTNQEVNPLSDLVLANVEALAMEEEPIDPNKAYGYELQNCYDDEGERIIGASCTQVEDRKASCSYSSAWGKC